MTAQYPTLRVQSPAPLSGSARPRSVLHPLLRPATLFMFDMTDPHCHPGGVITPGPVAIGTTFVGLDDAGTHLVASEAGWTVNADGSLSPPGNVNSPLLIGDPGQFDLSAIAPTPETLATLWLEVAAVPPQYYPFLSTEGSDRNHAQLTFGTDAPTDHLKLVASVSGKSGQQDAAAGAAIETVSLNAVHQLGVNFAPGDRLTTFIDGEAGAVWASAPFPATFNPAPAAHLIISGRWSGKLFGFSYHNITASRAAEVAFGFELHEQMSAAQHIREDWLFGTGQHPGAPSTAFAA